MKKLIINNIYKLEQQIINIKAKPTINNNIIRISRKNNNL